MHLVNIYLLELVMVRWIKDHAKEIQSFCHCFSVAVIPITVSLCYVNSVASLERDFFFNICQFNTFCQYYFHYCMLQLKSHMQSCCYCFQAFFFPITCQTWPDFARQLNVIHSLWGLKTPSRHPVASYRIWSSQKQIVLEANYYEL